jgi:hypothetical protein
MNHFLPEKIDRVIYIHSSTRYKRGITWSVLLAWRAIKEPFLQLNTILEYNNFIYFVLCKVYLLNETIFYKSNFEALQSFIALQLNNFLTKKKQLQISVRERSILIEFSVMFRVVFKDAYTRVLSLSSA